MLNKNLDLLNKETMSSIEISELTGKQHKHILVDIRNMLIELDIDAAGISATQSYGNNNVRQVFNLDKELTITLVSGYNVKMRNAIIKRWQELEGTVVKKAPLYFPAQTVAERLSDISKSIDILDRLSMLDDRDRLHYADSVRNAGMALVPQSTEILPVTISSRVVELGKKASAGELQKIGKSAVRLYREFYGDEPVKHTQYVQGAARMVNSYTTEHLDIIDSAINEVIG